MAKAKSLLPELLEIQEDFLGEWQPVLDLILEIPKVFKIKGSSLKEIKQSQIRSAFFGGVNQRDEPFEIDGI